ncbi:MAG: tetratricopeptide repeat protein [Gammaproteobacteria bacterium]
MIVPTRAPRSRAPARLALPVVLVASFALAACAVPAGAPAPPSAAAATHAELERAVAAYEAGRVDEARAAFERLASAGVPAADYNLGVMHLRGEVAGASVAQALQRLQRAAQGGFVAAMLDLARLHEQGVATGRPDLHGAHRWFLLAAAAGSAEAMVEAGTAYYLGRGAPQDAAAAAHWYREAAQRGDVGAMYLIASMYEAGLGVDCDLRLALYWYSRGADQGDVAAAAKAREIGARLSGTGC